jgi:hypothetical protein
MRRFAVVDAALVLVPSAFAWTTLGGAVLPQVVPSLLRTQSGTELSSWDSPTAGTIVVARNGGAPKTVVTGDADAARAAAERSDPALLPELDTQDRLWAILTSGSAVHAARSRSHGAHFGATVTVAMPATAHGIAAVALAGAPGSADVVINSGSSLIRQPLQPGLSVRVTKATKKVGKVKIVTRWARALDDGFAVPTATFRIAGRTYHANTAGKAKVPAGSGKAAAPGHVGASFHA